MSEQKDEETDEVVVYLQLVRPVRAVPYRQRISLKFAEILLAGQGPPVAFLVPSSSNDFIFMHRLENMPDSVRRLADPLNGYNLDNSTSLQIESLSGNRSGAWYTPSSNPIGSILFCHGSGGNRGYPTHRVRLVKILRHFGFNVLTIDYSGYGDWSSSPTQNMMAQGQLASQNGVVQGRFQLDAFAEQGEWKIEVEARTATERVEESYSFDVEEYVLPKFEVTIASDNFIIKDDAEDLPFNIEAKYTFGKLVPGTMTAKLMRLPCEGGFSPWRAQMTVEMECPPLSDCPETDEQGCFVPPEITQTFGQFSGSEANLFPYSSINEMMSFEQENYWCECGNDLLVEVEVEDRYSGEVRTAQKVIKVEHTRYKMEWLYEPNLPRPDVGMKYIGKVSLIDGASLDLNGRVEVVVSSGYTYEGCERCEYEASNLDIPIDAAESDGIFTVDIPEQFFAKNSFNVRATLSNRSGKDSAQYVEHENTLQCATIGRPLSENRKQI